LQLLTLGKVFVDKYYFAVQSNYMRTNWAEENLQTIRTLMERSAVYRRALAPIMFFAGVMGILAALVGLLFRLKSPHTFGELWLGTAMIVVIVAFFIARRQAVKDKENFWSPPTRRVGQALLPPLTAGMVLGVMLTWGNAIQFLPFIWALLYGCALHSAGFFISSGVKWFGWIYIGLALSIMLILTIVGSYYLIPDYSPHWLMGFFFGVLHLTYGAYLYLTEKGKNAA
jgi:hypothetical protein